MSDGRALLRASPLDPRCTVAVEARQIGMLTLEQKRARERLAGREPLMQVVAGLPSDRREEFEDLSMFAWCRCSTLNLVLAGVAEASGREVDGFVHAVVRRSFGVVLRSVWRLLARFTSDAAIVERASMLYGRTLDRGRHEVKARLWPRLGVLRTGGHGPRMVAQSGGRLTGGSSRHPAT